GGRRGGGAQARSARSGPSCSRTGAAAPAAAGRALQRGPGRGLEAQGLRARALGHEHLRLRLRAALRPAAPDVRPGDPARPARRPAHRDGPRLLAAYPPAVAMTAKRRWWAWSLLGGAALVAVLVAARPFGRSPLPDRWREARAGWLYRSAQIDPRDVEPFLREPKIQTILDLSSQDVDPLPASQT